MKNNKKKSDFFSEYRPNDTSPKRVVGERGTNGLPPGRRGGEKMTPERHEEHKQHTFDSFCKKVLKYEAYKGYRAIRHRQRLEVTFSELPEEAMEQLSSCDHYPWEFDVFVIGDDLILVENDALAKALAVIPDENRDPLVMYFFLEMTDQEIAERLHLPRKTVNNRRLKALRMLKERMGGDADE